MHCLHKQLALFHSLYSICCGNEYVDNIPRNEVISIMERKYVRTNVRIYYVLHDALATSSHSPLS